ncbi:hypothetical protein Pan241w_13970 [Gimesia alba]|uniref:Uncharacterized protein n=1 Tax=Gimesia alba TaxID=2527973 RepID=A0A517RBS1_9PLAN|nr:hypothetical protein Pan241w_13970 [Gimesia alba]
MRAFTLRSILSKSIPLFLTLFLTYHLFHYYHYIHYKPESPLLISGPEPVPAEAPVALRNQALYLTRYREHPS